MARSSSKRFTEKDFYELNAQISSLISPEDVRERNRLEEELLSVLAFLYEEAPARWHKHYVGLLLQTALELEVPQDEFKKYERLDLTLAILGGHPKGGGDFFLVLEHLSDLYHSDKRARRVLELYERHMDTAEQWQKKSPKLWNKQYLKILNEFSTRYLDEFQFDRAFVQLKKYFEIFDPQETRKIEDFIHPWMKFQQSAVNSNTEDKSFFDYVSTKHIEFYKQVLGAGYIEKINQTFSEYQMQTAKNSDNSLLRERVGLFKRVFIEDDLLGV